MGVKFVDSDDNSLQHIGVKRRSGRYPWGSGKNPYQHSGDFLSRVNSLKAAGLSETQIARSISEEIGDPDFSTYELRAYKAQAKYEQDMQIISSIKTHLEDGASISEVGRRLGINESSVRGYLKRDADEKMHEARKTADFLKAQVDKKGYIDVGKGVEQELGITDNKLKQALLIATAEGYERYGIRIPQPNDKKKQTIVDVLAKPGTTNKFLIDNPDLIQSVADYKSSDGGETFELKKTIQYPASLDSNRIKIVYAEEGGNAKDGVMELRRGVDDISLGNSSYAQVRILVDGTHYLKGMALYSDNMPKGKDIIFYTSKKKGTPKEDVLKKIKDDPDNPFGAAIKENGQLWYKGKDGKDHLGVVNLVNEEGDWGEWKKNLSSQFLSKQPEKLVKQQLNLSYSESELFFDELKEIDNPTVKRKLLEDFAGKCDSKAVELKAAALPRQATRVILPIDSLKDNEIYAPSYKNGEHVVLVRHPHQGTFELPALKVNNKHAEAKKILGNTMDAVGINTNVAQVLSGADFDGDSVVVIPIDNLKTKIKTTEPLEQLKGFDPKAAYPYKEGMKVMSKRLKENEMGQISNLITDMTLKGAPLDEIARATKHAQVVIDAEKHKLNYRQSYIDNNIKELKDKWQGRIDENGRYSTAASTIVSRASRETQTLATRGNPNLDPNTGRISYEAMSYKDPKTGKIINRPSKIDDSTYIQKQFYGPDYNKPPKKNGEPSYSWQNLNKETYSKAKAEGYKIREVEKQHFKKVPEMATVEDAYSLSSGHPIENAYAEYANKMKSLANKARKEAYSTGRLAYSKHNALVYSKEVNSLEAQLRISDKNRPKERQAQIIANSNIKAKLKSNPSIMDADKGKLRNQELNRARKMVGASGKDSRIKVSPKEWEAIQAGAISDTKLSAILMKCDMDQIKEYAMPKKKREMTSNQISLISSMNATGYSISEIAERLGVSASTVSKYIKQ